MIAIGMVFDLSDALCRIGGPLVLNLLFENLLGGKAHGYLILPHPSLSEERLTGTML